MLRGGLVLARLSFLLLHINNFKKTNQTANKKRAERAYSDGRRKGRKIEVSAKGLTSWLEQ